MGHTALQAASQNGQIDVIKLLVGQSADLEQEVGNYITRYDVMNYGIISG